MKRPTVVTVLGVLNIVCMALWSGGDDEITDDRGTEAEGL